MKFQFDALKYEHASRRNVVFSKKGMVATGNPLAAQVGLEILKKGGNAIDAAIATAATLTVVEPTANGIGGDAFAILWNKGKLVGLNSSGPAPKSISAEKLIEKGFDKVPDLGIDPITVPGVPKAWAELSKKYGKLSFEEVLEPAIKYAKEGYVIQPTVSKLLGKAYDKYAKELEKNPVFKHWFDTFAPNGRALKAGEVLTLKDHAATLEEIAKTGADSFYKGALAEKIANFIQENGGYLTKEDLAEYNLEWVEPIGTEFHGYDVFEIPPNGHGISVLMALNILKHKELSNLNSFDSIHNQIEAMKLAFVDAQKYITEPSEMTVTVEQLLSDEYAKNRAALINDKAIMPEPGDPIKGGTVYLCVADEEGNMISYIQSNYMGFGSGIVIPNTGIAMHNRGANFNLKKDHDNCIKGGKRPYHTIIPGFLMKDGKPVGPFGIMGGFMQPQAHLQVMLSTIIGKANPQDALDKPRWQWVGGKKIEVEQHFDNCIAQELQRAGHEIVVAADSILFGRGEIIWVDDNGVLCGATEPRTDGSIAAW